MNEDAGILDEMDLENLTKFKKQNTLIYTICILTILSWSFGNITFFGLNNYIPLPFYIKILLVIGIMLDSIAIIGLFKRENWGRITIIISYVYGIISSTINMISSFNFGHIIGIMISIKILGWIIEASDSFKPNKLYKRQDIKDAITRKKEVY